MKLLILLSFFIFSDAQTGNHSRRSQTIKHSINKDIPAKNKEFINYIIQNGKQIAPSYETANCVQFMDKIITNYIPNVIDDMLSERIYIKEEISHVEKLLKRGDSLYVSGVCGALISCNQATWVKPEDAKRGDIIQYWTMDGFLNGHCGILYDEDKDGYVLLSSHHDSNGYGKMNMRNKHYKNIKIFIVRLK